MEIKSVVVWSTIEKQVVFIAVIDGWWRANTKVDTRGSAPKIDPVQLRVQKVFKDMVGAVVVDGCGTCTVFWEWEAQSVAKDRSGCAVIMA